ncbi:kinesin-like protein KIFC1 isoform X2 [Dermacentor albipictus]|uniref:kinesin-like protein KIFC1 isoform X2 n=1 Tax=Dermacentor albipictus TaxID=60249 RepID=UPI0031FC3DE5
MAAADRPQTPCPGPAPMLHRTVLGVEASLPSGTASGARPKTFNAALVASLPGRRKAWDLQGPLQDLQERLKALKAKRSSSGSRVPASSSEAQKLSARALSDSLLTELHSAAQQVATLGQSLTDTAGAFAALTCDDAALMENQIHHGTARKTL